MTTPTISLKPWLRDRHGVALEAKALSGDPPPLQGILVVLIAKADETLGVSKELLPAAKLEVAGTACTQNVLLHLQVHSPRVGEALERLCEKASRGLEAPSLGHLVATLDVLRHVDGLIVAPALFLGSSLAATLSLLLGAFSQIHAVGLLVIASNGPQTIEVDESAVRQHHVGLAEVMDGFKEATSHLARGRHHLLRPLVPDADRRLIGRLEENLLGVHLVILASEGEWFAILEHGVIGLGSGSAFSVFRHKPHTAATFSASILIHVLHVFHILWIIRVLAPIVL
mmetsp:Transcript_19358/g.41174  ORF Transcript_19358/g.41174 Transcript_19358/m.41174 type:complete len:285 (+) Transcript_19358:282-1136(+)